MKQDRLLQLEMADCFKQGDQEGLTKKMTFEPRDEGVLHVYRRKE